MPEEKVKHKGVSWSVLFLLVWIPGQGCKICFWVGGKNRTDTLGRIIREMMVVRENQWVWSVVFFSGEVKVSICEQKISHIPDW